MGNIEVHTATSTKRLLQQGYYINSLGERVDLQEPLDKALANTQLYNPEELELLPARFKRDAMATRFEATRETNISAIQRLQGNRSGRVMCLNFASLDVAAGTTENTQQDRLINASGLGACLSVAPSFYEHQQSAAAFLYTDYMLHSPKVPFFLDDDGRLTDKPYYAGIITAMAVNAGAICQHEPENTPRIEITMRIRIRKMLTLCAAQGYEHLVLGAWGCGEFKNDPVMVAELFRETLTDHFAGCFRHIIFAVDTDDEHIFQPFYTRFNGIMYYLMY